MSRFNPRSIRVRLTLWYSCALVLVALILAGASRWALTVSLNHALDQSLHHRLVGLHGFIEENSREGLDVLAVKLRSLDHLGELLQVFGPNGELMAQSDGLARHHVSTQPPPNPKGRTIFRSAGPTWFPLRMAAQQIYAAGQPLLIEVADPQRKFEEALHEFYLILSLALPVVLAVAAFGGLWLSNRALSPVDRIMDEARALSPSNLSARLSVPASGDELQRLSETLNQMLSRVERSVGQVRRFTADASHELRAPMTLIYTAAEFALRRDRRPDELKDALRRILREAQRSTELINQLLALARSDAGVRTMQFASADICEFLREVVSEVSVLAAARQHSVSIHTPQHQVHREVDVDSFRRLLLILLDNAVKYTPDGGIITVNLIEDSGNIAIAISDTGPGIPANQLPFVFDRFWRADKVRTRDAGGTGLGLAIARDIAEAHGADLLVESTVGRGATFTVRLPEHNETSPAFASSNETSLSLPRA